MRARCLVLGAVLMLGATARAADGPLLSVDTSRLGRIDVLLGDEPGTTGRIYERVGDTRALLGEVSVGESSLVRLTDAMSWSCTRRTRRVVADVVHPDGSTGTATYAVRTPGCRDRLVLGAPAHALPGGRAVVTVTDGWSLGDVAARLCVRPPAGRPRCRPVPFSATRLVSSRSVRLRRAGVWRLDAILGRWHTRRAIAVGLVERPDGPRARPTMLVTGDSTAQGIDASLGDRLGGSVDIVGQVTPGSGLGHDFDPWLPVAVGQARRVAPRLTVISTGANEGYPMRTPAGPTVACCDVGWRAEYARRVKATIRAFVRGGRGSVLWLTLPAPRDPRRARISRVVDAAIRSAAHGVPGAVAVRLDRVLSPGWSYHRTITYRGRRQVVRTPDGIHLTPSGTAIAADLVVRALARWGQGSTRNAI